MGSFWMEPRKAPRSYPRSSATATYWAMVTAAAVEAVIRDQLTWSSGMSRVRVRMSSMEVMLTPVSPTSLAAQGWSASRPIS